MSAAGFSRAVCWRHVFSSSQSCCLHVAAPTRVRRREAAFWFSALWLALALGGLCWASEEATPIAVFPGLSVYGGVQPRVEAIGRIADSEGELLEFLAVEKTGRAYESLLTLECRPSALQAALLLLGCRPGQKGGSRLSLDLGWETEGKSHRAPVGDLLLERRTRKPPGPLSWMFTGSQFVTLPGANQEVFLADAEEAFIGLYPHEGLLIELDGAFGNPYRDPQAGFGVNASRLPPKGTQIRLILRMLR